MTSIRTRYLIAASCAATVAGPAHAQSHSGGYIYWPGHFRGAYEAHGPSSSRSDRTLDPVAIAALVAQIASAPKDTAPRNDVLGDRNGSRLASRLCTAAAEDRFDGRVRVSSIGAIARVGDGYAVRGMMLGDSASYRFACNTRFGKVDRIDIGPAQADATTYGPP
jgi:hypothetical protein